MGFRRCHTPVSLSDFQSLYGHWLAFVNIRQTLAEMLSVEKAFHTADLDGNGTVNADGTLSCSGDLDTDSALELDKFLMDSGEVYSDRQVKQILHEIDVDGNEELDIIEFLTVQQMIKHPEVSVAKAMHCLTHSTFAL